MFISIVIPTYNDLNSLSQLIEKILNQTFLPKEIIIIDASTNNNIRDYVKNINTKIDIIFKSYFNYHGFSSGYPGQSRNIGIQLAQYDYVAFLDTKTFPEPDWLKFQINNLKISIFGETAVVALELIQKGMLVDNKAFTGEHITIEGRATFVLIKKPTWKIVHIHLSKSGN